MNRLVRSEGAWAGVLMVALLSACTTAPVSAARPDTAGVTAEVPAACTTLAECEFACRQKQYLNCEQLAHMYETGQGAPQNLPRAASFYAEACDGGRVEACAHLALMYDIGLGVGRDAGRAAFLYERACAQGDRWSCTRGAALGPTLPAVGQPPQHSP